MTVLVEEALSPLRSHPAPTQIHLPTARGPVSQSVIDFMTGGGGEVVDASSGVAGQPHDDDFQTALWVLNTLQVATFHDVDPDRVASLRMRTLHWYLEQTFEAQLRRLVSVPAPGDLLAHLRSLVATPAPTGGASPASVRRRFVAQAPLLGWEADPHTLALARLEAPLKAAVVAVQSEEYGAGQVGADTQTHADVYRRCLADLGVGLAEAVAHAPACSLALANAAWLFGRDRRMRGAAVGQLCLLELAAPRRCARERAAWDAAGLPGAARRWYDVHAQHDPARSRRVVEDLVPTLERATPWLVADAAWGAGVTSVLQGCVDRACVDGAAH